MNVFQKQVGWGTWQEIPGIEHCHTRQGHRLLWVKKSKPEKSWFSFLVKYFHREARRPQVSERSGMLEPRPSSDLNEFQLVLVQYVLALKFMFQERKTPYLCQQNSGLGQVLGWNPWCDLDRSQSVFYFVPQESHSQAGSTNVTPVGKIIWI